MLIQNEERLTEEEAFARNTYTKELEDLELLRAWVETLPGVDPARVGLLGSDNGVRQLAKVLLSFSFFKILFINYS